MSQQCSDLRKHPNGSKGVKEVDLSPRNFGLPKILWRQLLQNRNKTIQYCQSDKMFRQMPWYSAYMDLHPQPDFAYTFNSWGMRANYNYEELNVDGKKAEIILAMGDSFTMNVGGPLEDSWPSLLQEKVNIPVLNGGIDGLGPEVHVNMIAKMREYFNVQHTFCLFNLHGGMIANQLADANDVEQRSSILKKYEWPIGCEGAFIPPWCWTDEMRKILLENFPDAFAYMKDIDFKYADIPHNIFVYLVNPDYLVSRTASWPSLDAIYNQLAMHNHMDNMLSDSDRYFFLKTIAPKCKSYFYRNRDYRHNSRATNQMIADYFVQKIDKKFLKM